MACIQSPYSVANIYVRWSVRAYTTQFFFAWSFSRCYWHPNFLCTRTSMPPTLWYDYASQRLDMLVTLLQFLLQPLVKTGIITKLKPRGFQLNIKPTMAFILV